MTVNTYFGRGRKSEQDILELTIIEMIQMAGHDFYYIKRDMVKPDLLLNEAPLSQFTEYATIEMYPTSIENFGGQGHLLGKLGLDVGDSLELVVSKRRAQAETGLDPLRAGDLIYWPMMNSLWQINFVEVEMAPFYSLSNLYTFKLKCTRFVYGQETFNTGVKELDAINNYETPFEKNDVINDAADSVLDFSEDNPFGTTIKETEPDSNDSNL